MDEVNGGLKPFCAVEWTVDQEEINSWQSDVFQVLYRVCKRNYK